MAYGTHDQSTVPHWTVTVPQDRVYLVLCLRGSTAADNTGSIMSAFIGTPEGLALLESTKMRKGIGSLDAIITAEPNDEPMLYNDVASTHTSTHYSITWNPPVPIMPQESFVAYIPQQQE